MDALYGLSAPTGMFGYGAPMGLYPAYPMYGAAMDRLSPMAPMGFGYMNPMASQINTLQYLVGMLMGLMAASPNALGGCNCNNGGGFSPFGGGGGFSPFGGGGSPFGGGGGGGTNIGGGGSGPYIPTGPVAPGTQGLLDHARSMIGMTERGNTAQIQQVTGKSGINPATTPWCAAWAMNLLQEHGMLDLSDLSNRNYCPTIKSWAQGKGIWGERGRYTPKPGDAIEFDWQGDGTTDHIGIVEKVENGKVYTIEGNSSDSVKRNVYDLNSAKIAGYVITGKK